MSYQQLFVMALVGWVLAGLNLLICYVLVNASNKQLKEKDQKIKDLEFQRQIMLRR